ncbi:MAG: tetratricopeptide repeat protein [Rubrobacteraceae bacterium]
MAGQGDNGNLTDRLQEALLEFVEQHADTEEELEQGREIAAYVVELMRPALEAQDKEDYLDSVRHLDDVSGDVTNVGFGDLVMVAAQRASERARNTEQRDLVRGWAHRARGYVNLFEGEPGKARRRFRRALRYGEAAQDVTLIGASWLSIGVSFSNQDKKRQVREAYEAALPYARKSDEHWILAYLAVNLAALMGPEEANEAERLYEEAFRAMERAPYEMSPASALVNLGILRSRQGRYSAAERLFEEALEKGNDADPRGVLLPLQSLGKVLSEQRRYAEAAERYDKGIQFAQRVGDAYREGVLRSGLAANLAKAGEYGRSYEQFSLLVESADRYGIPEATRATLVRDLGVTAVQLGRIEEGVARFREARHRYETFGDKRGAAGSILDEARARNETPEEQVRLTRETLELLKGTRHHDVKLDAYRLLVWAHFEQMQIDEAIAAFAQERRLLRRLGRTRTLARRLAEIGSLLSNVRLHMEAIRMFQQSVGLYEELGDETGFVEARNDLANRFVEIGETAKAEEMYLDNLGRAQELDNRALQLNALLNLGELCRRENRTDEALRRFQEAIRLGRALHDLRALALGLNNLGLALERTGDSEGALSAFEQSLQTADEAHDEAAAASALSSMGSSALRQENYAKAREMYDEAVERASEADDTGLRAEMLLNLAAAVNKQQGTEAAEPLVESAIDAAQQVLHYDTAFSAAHSITAWFLENKNMETAGKWSAYALLFGPLLSGEVDEWATWIVTALFGISEESSRNEFLNSMEVASRRLEQENELEGQLTSAVEAIHSAVDQGTESS